MTSDAYVPTRDDRFSFGIWTVGWQGVDVFGSAVRPAMPADRAVRKLAELGAYGVNFHDNDVFAFDATEAGRDERIGAFRKALDQTGLVVTTATTNLFGHPMFKDGAFTAKPRTEDDAGVWASAAACMRNYLIRLCPRLGLSPTWRRGLQNDQLRASRAFQSVARGTGHPPQVRPGRAAGGRRRPAGQRDPHARPGRRALGAGPVRQAEGPPRQGSTTPRPQAAPGAADQRR